MEVQLTNTRVVAVDGGTATGKSRLVEELATLLRLKGVPVVHVSSGHLYRAVAYVALDWARTRIPGKRTKTPGEVTKAALAQVRTLEADRILELARQRQIEMHGGVVWLDGVPASVDDQLKAPGVGTGASIVSRQLPVRELVDTVIRRQVNEFDGFVLIDGRDITHTVVPDAPLKFLLTVAPEVAAQRSSEHTVEEVVARDDADRNRLFGELRHAHDPGEGVQVIVTDKHTPESIRDEVYSLMRRVFSVLPEL
jgi:cytidylate kinase